MTTIESFRTFLADGIGVDVSDLFGKSRQWDLVRYRRAIAVVLCRHYKWRSHDIGAVLNRERSCVTHYMQSISPPESYHGKLDTEAIDEVLSIIRKWHKTSSFTN